MKKYYENKIQELQSYLSRNLDNSNIDINILYRKILLLYSKVVYILLIQKFQIQNIDISLFNNNNDNDNIYIDMCNKIDEISNIINEIDINLLKEPEINHDRIQNYSYVYNYIIKQMIEYLLSENKNTENEKISNISPIQ